MGDVQILTSGQRYLVTIEINVALYSIGIDEANALITPRRHRGGGVDATPAVFLEYLFCLRSNVTIFL